MPISTPWTSPTRPSATPWNGRSSISGFVSYTWENAPDDWATAVGDWDSYGTIITGTPWTSPR